MAQCPRPISNGMKFNYIATQADGKTVTGNINAKSSADVLLFLAGKGMKPVSIVLDAKKPILSGIFGGHINIVDQIFLTKYLALMLRVGADLLSIIDILIADFEKAALRVFLLEMKENLQKGQPLHFTFAKHPEHFSPVFVGLVKAGEKSGNLDSAFETLSATLDRERGFRSRIFDALVYPMFLLVVSVLMVFFLVTFALPRISGVFSGTGFEPPAFSRAVFAVGNFLSQNVLVISSSFLIILAFAIYFLAYTAAGKKMMSRFFSFVPVVSSLYRKISVQRFTATFSALMKSGLPILDSLEITAGVVTYPGMREAMMRVSGEGVAKGLSLGAAFRKETVFPQVVTNLIAISEKAGHIEDVLLTLSAFYESEVDTSMKRLVSFVEPAMLLILGALVGLISLSIIIPIYQLVGQF